MATKNVYMEDQVWTVYDPSQWVLVPTNRQMFFSANPPEWMDEQMNHGLKQLEMTVNRDKFVSDKLEDTMKQQAEELMDVMINKDLSHAMGWED